MTDMHFRALTSSVEISDIHVPNAVVPPCRSLAIMRLHSGVHVRSDALRGERERAGYVAVGIERLF